MAKRAFTETWIENLKPPAGGFTPFKEHGRRGFLLRVYAGGAKVFFYQFSWAGKPVFLKLREWLKGTKALADAHKQHAVALDLYIRGINPKEEREREAKAREAADQRRKIVDAVTIRNVIAEWAWHYARRERKRPREAVRLLKVHLLKPLAGKAAAEITKRDLVKIIDPVLARGSLVMANRLRDLLVPVFAFAAERDLIPSSPAAGLGRKPGGDEESKDRALSPEEIKTVWSVLDGSECPISRRLVCGLKLVLVTAQRPGEVIAARFDQFDIEQRAWTIPPETIKTVKKARRGKKKQPRAPRAHLVPLTDTAVELVEELRILASGRPCLLPAQRSKRNSDGHIDDKALAHALRDQIDEKTGTLFGLSPFTPHDLRRTAATMMTSLGIPRHPDVAKVLNHAEEEDDTTGIYDRFQYWPQKQRALQVWETELRAIIVGKAGKVVPIDKERRA